MSRLPARRLPLLALTAWIALRAAAGAEEQVETYPDGTQKAVYTIAADGTRNGVFKEYHPDGKLKAQGAYRQGKLSGPYKSHYPSGRIHVRASYHDGELTGKYTEMTDQGKPLRQASYKEGKLHGQSQEYEDGELVKDELWFDGHLAIPRSAKLIAADLAAIRRIPIETTGEVPQVSPEVLAAVKDPAAHARRENALRALMSFRCICGLPYEDMKLDWTYIAHCEAGSQLLAKIGKLDHTPANPGMPEAEYRFAYEGTSKSNLSSVGSPADSIRMFMNDSDERNIDRVGHRRWCLNPPMLKTGFGSSGGFTAMWSMDRSRKDAPDYQYVAFPPRGLVPTESFRESYAWSVSVNPKKYREPDPQAVEVQVFPAAVNLRRGSMEKAPAALPIGYFKVSLDRFAIPNCIIFRPAGVKVRPGAAYWVEISGLKTAAGEDATVAYLVAFAAI